MDNQFPHNLTILPDSHSEFDFQQSLTQNKQLSQSDISTPQIEFGQEQWHNQNVLDSKKQSLSSYDSQKQQRQVADQKSNKFTGMGQIYLTKQVYSNYYADFFVTSNDDPNNLFKRFSTLANHYGAALLQNNIEIQKEFGNYIKLISASKCWKVISFSVHLWYFAVKVDLINLENQNQFEDYILKMGKTIGQGAWGNVYRFGRSCVMKQLPIKQSQNGKNYIQQYLKQYALLKLLSCLEIGPKVMRPLGFDVLCSKKCFSFFMEECESVTSYFSRLDLEVGNQDETLHKIVLDLKSSLFDLHMIQIVHYDIKPQNVMYSPGFNKFVYIDFGLSELKSFSHGYVEIENFKGTFNYCSDEMKQLCFAGTENGTFVDAYYNDCICLHNTLCHFSYSLRAMVSEKMDDGQFDNFLRGKKQRDSSSYADHIDDWYNCFDKEIRKIEKSNNRSSIRMVNDHKNQKIFSIAYGFQQDAQNARQHQFGHYDQSGDEGSQNFESMIKLTHMVRMRNKELVRIFLERRSKWVERHAQQIQQIFLQLDIDFPDQLLFFGIVSPNLQNHNNKEHTKAQSQIQDNFALREKVIEVKAKKMSEFQIFYTTKNQMQRQLHFNSCQQKYMNVNAKIVLSNREKFQMFSMGQDYLLEKAPAIDCLRLFWLMQSTLVKIDKNEKSYFSFCYFLHYLHTVAARPQLLIQNLCELHEIVLSISSYFPKLGNIFVNFNYEKTEPHDLMLLIGNIKVLVETIITDIYLRNGLESVSKLKDGLSLMLIMSKKLIILTKVFNLNPEFKEIINQGQQLITKISLDKVLVIKQKLNLFIMNDVSNLQMKSLFQGEFQTVSQIYQLFLDFQSQTFRQLLRTDISPQPLKTIRTITNFQARISQILQTYDGMQQLVDKASEKCVILYEKWKKGTDNSNLYTVCQVLYHRQLIMLEVPQVQHMIIIFRMAAIFILIKRQYLELRPQIVYDHIKSMKNHFIFLEKKFSKFPLMLQQQKAFLDLDLYETQFQALSKMGRLLQMMRKVQQYFDCKKANYDEEKGLMEGAEIEIKFRRELCLAYSKMGLNKKARQCKKRLISELQKLAYKYQHESENDYDINLEGNEETDSLMKTDIPRQSFKRSKTLLVDRQKVSVDRERMFEVLFQEIRILIKDRSVASFKNVIERIMQNRAQIVVEFEQNQSTLRAKPECVQECKQQTKILWIDVPCMDYIYKSFDSIFAVFHDNSLKNQSEASHVLIVLFYILIQRINYLTESIGANSLFADSKTIQILWKELDKVRENAAIVEALVFVQYVNSLLELSDRHLNALPNYICKVNTILIDLGLELRLKSNSLIESLMGKQNHANYPLLYWKNVKSFTVYNHTLLNQTQSSTTTTPQASQPPPTPAHNQSLLNFIEYLKKKHNISSIEEFLTLEFMTRCKQHIQFALDVCFEFIDKIISEVQGRNPMHKRSDCKQLSMLVFMRQISLRPDIPTQISQIYAEFITMCKILQKLAQHLIKEQMAELFLVNHKANRMTIFLITKYLVFGQYEIYINLITPIAQIVDLLGHQSKLMRGSYWRSCVQASLSVFKNSRNISQEIAQKKSKDYTEGTFQQLLHQMEVAGMYKILIQNFQPITRKRISSNNHSLSLIPFTLTLSIIELIYSKAIAHQPQILCIRICGPGLTVFSSFLQKLHRTLLSIMQLAFSQIGRTVLQEVMCKTKYWRVMEMWYECWQRLLTVSSSNDQIKPKYRWFRVLMIRKIKFVNEAQLTFLTQPKHKNTIKSTLFLKLILSKLSKRNQLH